MPAWAFCRVDLVVKNKNIMHHIIKLSVALALIWLANSGHYTPLILVLGALSVALVVFIAHKMDVVDHESQPLYFTAKIPHYFAWLFKELILSNIDVVKRIWMGPSSISPAVATLKVSQSTDMGRVLYANSITFTPGTITLDIQDDHIIVYALTESGLDNLRSGEMDQRVARLER